MSNLHQIIRAPNGDELVVLPRQEFDRLVALAGDAQEDLDDIAAYDAAMADLESGKAARLPERLSGLILESRGILSALRKYSGLTQSALADAVGVSQAFIASLEIGRKKPSPELLTKLRAALNDEFGLLA